MKTRGQIDPTSVANMWTMSRPRGEDRTNQMEMWKVVGLLSVHTLNAFAILKVAAGIESRDDVLYKAELCGGLVLCDGGDNFDMALAGISMAGRNSRFEFRSMEEGPFSAVLIFPSPLIYTMNDRAMLYGVIQHELRHFMDFVENGRKPIESDYFVPHDGGYELDVDKYSRNITEMRAHADQAAALMRIMGGGVNAKKAIRESHLGGHMIPDIVEAMMAFIDALDEENRRAGFSESIDPPAVVARSEDHDVRALVGHLERMVEVMKFSNNVFPRK